MLNRKQQSPGPHMTRDSVVQDNAKPKSTKFNTMHIQRKCSPGLRGPNGHHHCDVREHDHVQAIDVELIVVQVLLGPLPPH